MRQAIIDPEKCNPSACDNGICLVKRTCPVKAIYQAEPFEVPVTDWNRCRTCTKCIVSCPAKAIRLA